MSNGSLNLKCLCGSGLYYSDCCQPYHLKTVFPETAEQLMRSRYVAYALNMEAYLLNTWADVSRPAHIDVENGLSWQSLKILKTKKGLKKDSKGWVKFTAVYQVGFEQNEMTENSKFIRNNALHWVYLDCD